jgi:hypothetical protein
MQLRVLMRVRRPASADFCGVGRESASSGRMRFPTTGHLTGCRTSKPALRTISP